jgi:hypothetical protein
VKAGNSVSHNSGDFKLDDGTDNKIKMVRADGN